MRAIKHTMRRLYSLMPSQPSTNYHFRSFDVNPYALLPANAVILDLASKDRRATYGFGAPPADATVICIDIEPGDGVDIVADAHQLPLLSSNSVDCVLCVSFLYAARYPAQVVREIHRVLRPGGIFYVSVPYVFPGCADPGDYYRFSHSGLEVLCEEFERLDGGFNRGPASTMAELGVRFMAMLLCFNNRYLYFGLRYVLKWPLSLLKYLDKFMARYAMAYEICSGAYFIGRKNGADAPAWRPELAEAGLPRRHPEKKARRPVAPTPSFEPFSRFSKEPSTPGSPRPDGGAARTRWPV